MTQTHSLQNNIEKAYNRLQKYRELLICKLKCKANNLMLVDMYKSVQMLANNPLDEDEPDSVVQN